VGQCGLSGNEERCDQFTSLLPGQRRTTEGRKWLGTVENHGNTEITETVMEITETVIFVKCRDFAKIPCCRVFWPKCRVLRFYNNILFLISVS